VEIKKLDGKNIVILSEDSILIENGQAILDILMSARYNSGCSDIIIRKENIAEEFFDLRSGLAGEITQKIANYRFRVAIVGDFSAYKSKNLKDFLYESNKGNTIFFVPDIEAVVEKLS